MNGWQAIQPDYWRRPVAGGWLGVKRDGGRWQWLHHVDDFGVSAICFGLDTATEAMRHADDHLQTVTPPARSRRRATGIVGALRED